MITLASGFEQLLEMPNFLFLLMAIVGIVAIVSAAATSILVNRGREQTRREITAYVAEGSIEPDQAVALLNAGKTEIVEQVVAAVRDASDSSESKGVCCGAVIGVG